MFFFPAVRGQSRTYSGSHTADILRFEDVYMVWLQKHSGRMVQSVHVTGTRYDSWVRVGRSYFWDGDQVLLEFELPPSCGSKLKRREHHGCRF